MIEIQIQGSAVRISGSFDFGYMGRYGAGLIHLYDEPDELRDWDIVREGPGADCTDEALSCFLTEYFNGFEEKIRKNRKQVNDNFLILAYEDWEACGYPFWDIEGLVKPELLPEDPEKNVYNPYWDELRFLGRAFYRTPNDGSLEKPDVEAILREKIPSLDWDALLESIEPEYLSLDDGRIAFQCSDGFGAELLCGAYDVLDENLVFTEWHNH